MFLVLNGASVASAWNDVVDELVMAVGPSEMDLATIADALASLAQSG